MNHETLNLSRQERGGLVVTPNTAGWMQVWERPLVGCRYLLSVRPGGKAKVLAGKRDRERSVLLVLRRGYVEEQSEEWKPARLAARLVPPVVLEATPLAELVAIGAEWYGHALCFVEVKDGAILAKECQRLGASVQTQEVLDKTNGEFTQHIGWLSDAETEPAALNALTNAIRETGQIGSRKSEVGTEVGTEVESRKQGGLSVQCEHCLAEIEAFGGAEPDAPPMSHDDDVRALATGIYNIESASLLKPHTRARLAPQDGWK